MHPIRFVIAVTALAASTCSAEPASRGHDLRQAPSEQLDAYRASDAYLREAWRPQFHFTPERNWMNDPNGLVFHKGEYHLFYQHNPFGNEWGHMSWGHAVSRDLTRWEHLPIALWEEGEEMIFSGCCVVDDANTSGFGAPDDPPLVAVYTSHRPGNQAQSLAYSLDNGRTWTKHAENPVLDLKEADFRDPKVFWHEPTSRWVMVVSLAIQKRLQLYGSPNLKEWSLLSEFGPAGAEPKSNWECPDLFELAVEDADGRPTGETRWVLEVGMGEGSVAGGSGGEYFVGSFDGKRFVCDQPENAAQWIDYGRDFYAAVSWSDIPREDGRRIWIGWMNNWQTHMVPTSPWRSAMSVPRSLTLRSNGDRNTLVQRPVVELEELRRDSKSVAPRAISGVVDTGVRGKQLDLVLELDPKDASTTGVRVLAGDGVATVIGYDTRSHELFVDRRASGEVGFHPAFAGRHAAPLDLQGKPLRLRILVDSSSVEVFANDGTPVITDLVFPPDGADRVELFSEGGVSRLVNITAWRLQSVWRDD